MGSEVCSDGIVFLPRIASVIEGEAEELGFASCGFHEGKECFFAASDLGFEFGNCQTVEIEMCIGMVSEVEAVGGPIAKDGGARRTSQVFDSLLVHKAGDGKVMARECGQERAIGRRSLLVRFGERTTVDFASHERQVIDSEGDCTLLRKDALGKYACADGDKKR
jgi:hypothetical protein